MGDEYINSLDNYFLKQLQSYETICYGSYNNYKEGKISIDYLKSLLFEMKDLVARTYSQRIALYENMNLSTDGLYDQRQNYLNKINQILDELHIAKDDSLTEEEKEQLSNLFK